MRRFIAYLSLAFAGLVTVGATYNMAFTQTQTNMDFADGKELVFRLSDGDNEITKTQQNEMVTIMESRLKSYGSTKYQIITEGDDTIKVNVSETYQENYEQIKTYLTFDGSFALGTSENIIADGDAFLLDDKKAYLDYVNQYPTIVIPVDSENGDFKAVIEAAEKQAEESKPAEGSNEEAPKTYVYLAYNFNADDQISDYLAKEGEEPLKKDNKILMQFDIEHIWRDDEHKEIATMVDLDLDKDGKITTLEVTRGNELAKYYVNLLKCEPLPVEVTSIYENPIPPLQENLIAHGMHETAAWSKTLIATIFAIIILALLLGVFYRYGALSIGVVTILSTYCAMLLSILFRVEFNVASILGLCGVAIASLASGVIYLTKVKEECYHGRTLKKANSEGSKKALLPVVDINIVLIIIGAICYLLGGQGLTGLASMFIFGGLTSLILNVFLMRIMMWLLTNTTAFTGKYEIIGVEHDKVPSLIDEEEQTYFGPFQERDFTKKKKAFSITFIILALASIVGASTFGALNDGEMFNEGNYRHEDTYLYVETSNETSDITTTHVTSILDATTVGDSSTTLKGMYTIKDYKYDAPLKDNETIEDLKKITCIVVTFTNNYTGEEMVKYTVGETVEFEGTFNDLFATKIADVSIDSNVEYSLKEGTLVNKQQPESAPILIATTVALVVTLIYIAARYGLSRASATLIATALTTMIPVGFFALTRIVVLNELLIALPVALFIGFIVSVIFMDKDKDMFKEDFVRNKDNSAEHRHELSLKANALAAGPICVTLALTLFLAINFFGIGTLAMSNLFILLIVASIVAGAASVTIFAPLCDIVYRWLRTINLPTISFKKKSKKKVHKNKSGEPEEAIFIGMND